MDKSNVYYMERERLLLAQLISEEKIIECKKTGAADLKDKVDAWERINVTKDLIMFWLYSAHRLLKRLHLLLKEAHYLP